MSSNKNNANSLFIPTTRLNRCRILKLIRDDPNIKQFQIAFGTNLSVAMVNNYIRELEENGLIVCVRKTSKTLTYQITAAGSVLIEQVSRELAEEVLSMAKSLGYNVVPANLPISA